MAARHPDDLLFMMDGMMDRGRKEIEEGWKPSVASPDDLKLTTPDPSIRGDIAALTQRFAQRFRNESRKMAVDQRLRSIVMCRWNPPLTSGAWTSPLLPVSETGEVIYEELYWPACGAGSRSSTPAVSSRDAISAHSPANAWMRSAMPIRSVTPSA